MWYYVYQVSDNTISNSKLYLYLLFYSIDVNINIAEDENEEEIIEKRRKQREELLKVILNL